MKLKNFERQNNATPGARWKHYRTLWWSLAHHVDLWAHSDSHSIRVLTWDAIGLNCFWFLPGMLNVYCYNELASISFVCIEIEWMSNIWDEHDNRSSNNQLQCKEASSTRFCAVKIKISARDSCHWHKHHGSIESWSTRMLMLSERNFFLMLIQFSNVWLSVYVWAKKKKCNKIHVQVN